MQENNINSRLTTIEMKQQEIDRNALNITTNLNMATNVSELVSRALSALNQSFVSFSFGFFRDSQPTLNQITGDKTSLESVYGESLHAYTYTERNTPLKTHQGRYQCVLLPRSPNEGDKLSVGYFLFRVQEAGVLDQIYITISHPEPNKNPRETINLSVQNPPKNIFSLLNSLPFPSRSESASLELHPELMQWIASISNHNTINIHPYHIFLTEETTEKFRKYLSIEARNSQRIQGEEYRALVTENGWWASTSAFFGNAAANIWYARSGPPRQYGHDTVINHTEPERQNGTRKSEISLILPLLANRFIQNHSSEIGIAVREHCEQNGAILR